MTALKNLRHNATRLLLTAAPIAYLIIEAAGFRRP